MLSTFLDWVNKLCVDKLILFSFFLTLYVRVQAAGGEPIAKVRTLVRTPNFIIGFVIG